MNLEKLGFLLFLKATQDHQKVAEHFKKALMELVLAALNSAKVLQTATLESEVLKPYGSAHKTLEQFEILNTELMDWLTQVSASKNSAKSVLLRQVIDEILAGLNAEKESLQDQMDPQKSLQIEALKAIEEVLVSRFLPAKDEATNTESASKRNAS